MVSDTISMSDVAALCQEAGALLFDRQRADEIRTKGRADYVTAVDFAVQNFLKEKLTAAYPEVQFMSEEQDNTTLDKSRPLWVLDPVDGTMNLIYDLHHSAISLALVEEGEVQMGIVYQPFTRELFTAQKGKGAFLNGKPIHVSRQDSLKDSLIAIGTSPYQKELARENFDRCRRIFEACADIRRMGTASLDLIAVACGRADAFYERGLKAWDFAAGYLIVEEAGGKVTNSAGERPDPTAPSDIFAHNDLIGSELFKIL